MKSKLFEKLLQWCRWMDEPRYTTQQVRPFLMLTALIPVTVIALASCSSLGRPERQQSPVAPACSQRTPALDSGDPPSGADVTDWMAWAKAYVVAQYAVVDRDNKRAATADCLDRLAEIKP